MYYFLYPIKDTYIYEVDTNSEKNFGGDDNLVLKKDFDVNDLNGVSRVLLQFDLTELSQSIVSGEIVGSAKYYLRLYEEKTSELSPAYSLTTFPLSSSWEEGTGYTVQDPNSRDGASWERSDESFDNTNWVKNPAIKNNYSLTFDPASGDYLEVSSSGLTDITSGPSTVAGWYKVDADYNILTDGTIMYLFTRGPIATAGYSLAYQNSGGTPRLLLQQAKTGGYNYISYNVTFTVDTWYHIAWVNGGTSAVSAFYVNGTSVTTKTHSQDILTAASYPFRIGATYTGIQLWNGKIDEVGFWNTALDAASIKNIYNYGSPINLLSNYSSGLVGYWRMGDGTLDDVSYWPKYSRDMGVIVDQVTASLGSELMTNSDFSNGTTGWTNFGLSSFSVSNNQATIVGAEVNDYIYQNDVTSDDSDKTYKLVVDIDSITGTSFTINHNGLSTMYGANGLTTTGVHTYYFQNREPYAIDPRIGGNCTLVINSVSLKEVNGNPAIFVGSPTTGSDAPFNYQTDNTGSRTAGGGAWYVDGGECSQSFSYESPDVNMDVTDIVNYWLVSGSDSNNGLILKWSGSQEDSNDKTGEIDFYSYDANSIYSPKMEVRWDNHVACSGSNTGSLTQLYIDGEETKSVYPYMINLRDTYREAEIPKFRVGGRDKYQTKSVFTSKSTTLTSFIPENSGSYSIIDVETGETLIPFGSNSLLSCDSTSNYFKLKLKTFIVNRLYRIKLRIQLTDGRYKIFDNDYNFKVVR